MRKVIVFNLVTLDGCFTGEEGDISWHRVDEEYQELANEAANSGSTLLFGRVTYQLLMNPVALGRGRTMFEGIGRPLNFRLIRSRVFGNGNVLLCYEPDR